MKYLLKEAEPDDAIVQYRRLRDAVEPLKATLDVWHDHLVGPYLATHGRKNNLDGRLYLTNATGMVICPDDEKNAHRRRGVIAAFLLQGMEKAFIHALTGLSEEFGYTVLADEHDGLVTLGEIPTAAVDVAAEMAGLRYAVLEEKPFPYLSAVRLAA